MLQNKVFESLSPTLEVHHFDLWFGWLKETYKITAAQHKGMFTGKIHFKMPPNLSIIPRRKRNELLDDLAYIPGSPFFHAGQDIMALLDNDHDDNQLR